MKGREFVFWSPCLQRLSWIFLTSLILLLLHTNSCCIVHIKTPHTHTADTIHTTYTSPRKSVCSCPATVRKDTKRSANKASPTSPLHLLQAYGRCWLLYPEIATKTSDSERSNSLKPGQSLHYRLSTSSHAISVDPTSEVRDELRTRREEGLSITGMFDFAIVSDRNHLPLLA